MERFICTSPMSNPVTPPLDDFTYSRSPEGIHELRFHRLSTEALDECFKQIDIVFTEAEANKPLLLLTHMYEMSDPFLAAQLWGRVRRVLAKHPDYPFIYDAILYLDKSLFRVLLTLASQITKLYRTEVSFFSVDEREKATAWLLEKRDQFTLRRSS
jgi:hypothetical protein